MRFLRWFYAEAKVFELSVVERRSVLWFVVRSKGVSRAVHTGKVTVEWLLASVEALFQGEWPKDFIKSSRVGCRA
jgi:hypothetical protein